MKVRFAVASPLEGAGFEPSVPRQESRRFEPASVPSRGGRCRRGGYGPGGDRRPDRAVEIADLRWCASEPPLESRIKPSRRAGPSRGTDGSNPSPSRRESAANLTPADARASRDFTATLNRVSDQLAHDGVPEGDELHRSGRGTLGAVRRLGYLRPEARGSFLRSAGAVLYFDNSSAFPRFGAVELAGVGTATTVFSHLLIRQH